jgi:hypothetical protein
MRALHEAQALVHKTEADSKTALLKVLFSHLPLPPRPAPPRPASLLACSVLLPASLVCVLHVQASFNDCG